MNSKEKEVQFLKKKTCRTFHFFRQIPLHEEKNILQDRKCYSLLGQNNVRRSEQEMAFASTFKTGGRAPLASACQVLVSQPTSRQRGCKGVPPSRGIRPRDAGEVDPPPCGRPARRLRPKSARNSKNLGESPPALPAAAPVAPGAPCVSGKN